MKMTITELNEYIKVNDLHYHHEASQRGYYTRKGESRKVIPYSGRFGKGIKVIGPLYNTTNYCSVTYYVYKGGKSNVQ